MTNKRLKVCVIFGGQSPEHDISCISAASVINNLDKEKYKIITIGITKKGEWFLYKGKTSAIEKGEWKNEKKNLKKAVISPDARDKAIFVFEDDKVKKIKPDIVFPVLHGEYGEDGTIQGLLELAGIKYVGMGVCASANAMDKSFTKIIFQNVGIPQADWITVHTYELENINAVVEKAEKKLGYPCFVKPASTGSSVGVGKAKNRKELISALKNAAKFGRKILIEENIDGHEVECSVLGNIYPEAATVGEIIPEVEFYDFDAKYKTGTTKLQIPAKLPSGIIDKIREYAVTAFKALDGTGLSRVDFFVRYKDNSIVLNEINTMPGFTSISMYPKLWEAVGKKYSDLLDELIELGLKRVK
ncbi:MAG: D-alanine--D-alanine ligase family protein [Clostridia bacterium]|nr:D-alanine--D-alanine ligase family protein [Clostridia bacterium]